jgi:hypothetical protein
MYNFPFAPDGTPSNGDIVTYDGVTKRVKWAAGSGGNGSIIVAKVSGTSGEGGLPLTDFYTVPVNGAGLYRLVAAVSSLSTSYPSEFVHNVTFLNSDGLQFPALPFGFTISAGFTESGVPYPPFNSTEALIPDGFVIRYNSTDQVDIPIHYSFSLELIALFGS